MSQSAELDTTNPPASGAVRLDRYPAAFDRGRPRWVEAIWILTQMLLGPSVVPAVVRVLALRSFGARVGRGVTVKPGVKVKFPWRLEVGNHCWIGERAWLDNLAEIRIGDHCCVSQGAYLCTGSHDWSRPSFDLIVAPIILEEGTWIAACAVVGPGVTAGRGSVLALGSVATRDLLPWQVHQGVPASPVKRRCMAQER